MRRPVEDAFGTELGRIALLVTGVAGYRVFSEGRLRRAGLALASRSMGVTPMGRNRLPRQADWRSCIIEGPSPPH